MPDRWTILNFGLFQIGWLVCVLSAAAGTNLPAILMTAFFVLIHQRFYPWFGVDLKLIAAGVTVGLILDSSWSALGWMGYSAQSYAPIAPWWILCLWVNFMLTLNHSLAWMLPRWRLAAICSAIASPLSYFAGSKFLAIEWLQPVPMLIAASVSWAIVVPLLIMLANHLRKQLQESLHAVG